MNALPDALQALLRFLTAKGHTPPVREMLIVEVAAGALTDERGRLKVSFDRLPSPAQFEQRFEEILRSGVPWINVTCYGVERDRLLVGVEVAATPRHPAPSTSVNFSGPSRAVLENDWRVDAVLAIE